MPVPSWSLPAIVPRREANIFQPIRALRTRWLEDVTHSEVAERVRLLLVGRYLQKGVNAQELLERGEVLCLRA